MPSSPVIPANPAERPPSVVDYDAVFFSQIAAVEDRHFWFRARNRVISAAVRKLTSSWVPGYRVLEIGCGTGNVLRVLPASCPCGVVIGMEAFAEGLCYARLRTSCALVQGDARHLPFACVFRLVGLFDIVEHMENDAEFLNELHNVLLPSGYLAITVPAHPKLWSYFDTAAGHHRRYTCKELRSKLEASGYALKYMTEFMSALAAPMWLGRRIAGRRQVSEAGMSRDVRLAQSEFRIVPVINGFLAALLAPEAALIGWGGKIPLGTSILAIARSRQ